MKKRGFTLVEMLAVVAILAIVIGICIVVYTRVQQNILDSQLENTVSYIEAQAENYANDTNITVVSVEDLILDGYVEPDDETDIYNPVDNSSLNCYIVKSSYEDGKFTASLDFDTLLDRNENGTCNNYTKESIISIGVKEEGSVEYSSEIKDWYKNNVELVVLGANKTPLISDTAIYEWRSNYGEINTTPTITTTVSEGIVSNIPYSVTINYEEEGQSYNAEATATINIDRESPRIISINVPNSTEWSTSKTVTIKATDGNGSGLKGIYVGKDLTACTEDLNYTEVGDNTTIEQEIRENGTYKVCVIDNVGNVSESSETFEISHVDNTAPTCTITTNAKMGENNWYIEDANLVLNTSDDASGVIQKGMSTSSNVNYNNVITSLQRNTKSTTYYGFVKDAAGNTNTCSLNVKVDSTPPEITFNISGIYTATMTCSDDTSGINGKTNYTQRLTGTRDYTVNQTCTNNAGVSTTRSHTYDYSNCARGENTCEYGCDEYYDDCKYGHNTCEYGCGKEYDSCATGSNTCVGGSSQNCTTDRVCTKYTIIYCCYGHIGSTSCSTTTSPPSGWNTPGSVNYGMCHQSGTRCDRYENQQSCTSGGYDPCQSGSNTCQGGYVTDYGSCSSCYYGENTCRGGYVTIESTCDSCYYGHNTCEGGFLY